MDRWNTSETTTKPSFFLKIREKTEFEGAAKIC